MEPTRQSRSLQARLHSRLVPIFKSVSYSILYDSRDEPRLILVPSLFCVEPSNGNKTNLHVKALRTGTVSSCYAVHSTLIQSRVQWRLRMVATEVAGYARRRQSEEPESPREDGEPIKDIRWPRCRDSPLCRLCICTIWLCWTAAPPVLLRGNGGQQRPLRPELPTSAKGPADLS